jgi:hypothetical protein
MPTAVFGFSLDDTSLQGEMQGPREDERERLAALDQELQELLARSGCCSPVIVQQTQSVNIKNCNGCDVDLARKVGAKISVIGWVQKVSNLILNINLVARDVTNGRVIEVARTCLSVARQAAPRCMVMQQSDPGWTSAERRLVSRLREKQQR